MGVDCLVGLQYGSEGKGKWAGVIAAQYEAHVRVGAPNAGHTVYFEGKPYKMRQIPCGWVNKDATLYIGAAGLVKPELLAQELSMLPEHMQVAKRLRIDGNAGILTSEDAMQEVAERLNDFNGSTAEGVGPALARKLMRKEGHIANMMTDSWLWRHVRNTKAELWLLDEEGYDILIEGTQGYGLSLNHGPYPFCTSRDVTAASLLSDVGFAPKAVDRVFGVMRTYPIRVAGNSGPMGAQELTWEEVARRAGLPAGSIDERTTVTNRIRRVSEIDWDLLGDACRANEPDGILVSFIDYVDGTLQGVTKKEEYLNSAAARAFVDRVEDVLGVRVVAVSTGPRPEQTIVLHQEWGPLLDGSPLKEVA